MSNSNYNQKTQFCLEIEQKLKNKLKSTLQMTRLPRDITTFWAFYFLWTELHQYTYFQLLSTDDKYDFIEKSGRNWVVDSTPLTSYSEQNIIKNSNIDNQHYHDKPLTQSNSTTTSRHHNDKPLRILCQSIPLELPLFINTTSLQIDFKIKTQTYQPYLECFVKEYRCDWKYTEGKAREILSFTDEFVELMEWCDVEFGRLQYPETFIQYFCYERVRMHPKLLRLLDEKCDEFSEEERDLLWTDGYYKIKRTKSFRKYDNLVNCPKELRNRLFEGYYQLDLDACFASIAYHELGMKDCGLEYAELLCGSRKLEFRELIMQSFGCDYNKAKIISQYLFASPYTHSHGKNVNWFNNLHKEITKRLKEILSDKEKNRVEFYGKMKKIDCFHAYFTYHEQMIIQNIKNHPLFQIHDAIVLEPEDELILTKNIDANQIEYKNNIYYFKVEQI